MWIQNLKNNELCVQARFTYVDPRTRQPFAVIRAWPCKDQSDAQLIVKQHGRKTGAYEVDCIVEIFNEETFKQRLAEAKEIATKENSTASKAEECSV